MAEALLPYLPSPGSITNAFEKLKSAATPERVTGDFVATKLQLKGGSGASMLSFLKKIGFVGKDGSPTDIYRRFRGGASKKAAADAIRFGYKALTDANEYFYDLSDKDLLALILQVTGASAESPVPKLTMYTLKNLKIFADFETGDDSANEIAVNTAKMPLAEAGGSRAAGLGLNLSYTINLNLPATSDQAVFNAIFKSLKEHLLANND
ncbi:DUF5343 domain-containing protein [Mesorhizobium sp. M0518]|uniref:DUF5343 domain-containing protein n=1 Tax=Mesorhizobium sp. M0518 TaxID=2956956 RepID=UPI0033367ECA